MPTKFSFFGQEPGKQVIGKPQPSLLCLRGQTGTLACRVYEPLYAKLLPQRSEPWNRQKYAWLSEEKMHNLIAVRGRPGASMVGPADYFRDLDRSDQYLYTLDINSDRIPRFTEHPLSEQNYSNTTSPKAIADDKITRVNAKWFSGFDKEGIRTKKAEYQESSVFGGNLFPNSGILEIDGPKEIKFQTFDPTGVDLSAFKARLVPNNEPFQITAERLHVDDEYCAVTYQYDAGYADEQVKTGGGAFLEFHEFAQTITPLDPDTRGFVTLAKWNKLHTQLEMIAVQIPYGYTLIIDKHSIHGDTTLDGLFLMCMTSDHISMATADTVFLKQAASKENISLKLDNILDNQPNQRPPGLLDPLVFYDENKKTDFARFATRTKDMDLIFTPTRGYWEVKQQAIGTIGLFLLAGVGVPVAIILFVPLLIALAGIGLFKVLSEIPTKEENSLMPQALTI